MEKIRFGVIGCGGMTKSHLMGLLELSDELTVTATCDIIRERAKEALKLLEQKFL